jgi:hypothetical protein
VLPALPVVEVVAAGVLVVAAVVVVDVAAFAIAAPPPASAPVTTSVVSRAFNRYMFHLLRSRLPPTIAAADLRTVGAS